MLKMIIFQMFFRVMKKIQVGSGIYREKMTEVCSILNIVIGKLFERYLLHTPQYAKPLDM